jgi:hypothetical protein
MQPHQEDMLIRVLAKAIQRIAIGAWIGALILFPDAQSVVFWFGCLGLAFLILSE